MTAKHTPRLGSVLWSYICDWLANLLTIFEEANWAEDEAEAKNYGLPMTPIYDCGHPDCDECRRAFGPDRTKAIAAFAARAKAYAKLQEKNYGSDSARQRLRTAQCTSVPGRAV